MLRTPAKVNLALEILGKREDGYHEISTVLQAIDLFDRLTVEDAADLSLATTDPALPVDDANLVVRAARALGAAAGVTARRADRARQADPGGRRARRGIERRGGDPGGAESAVGAPLVGGSGCGELAVRPGDGRAVLPRAGGGRWPPVAGSGSSRCPGTAGTPWCW